MDRPTRLNLYGEDVEVDYRGEEVSVENFIRLLTGRHPPNTPRNKRLLTDSMSNVLVYITGHSGEEFIKFQDWEEITSSDIADAFQQMYTQRRQGLHRGVCIWSASGAFGGLGASKILSGSTFLEELGAGSLAGQDLRLRISGWPRLRQGHCQKNSKDPAAQNVTEFVTMLNKRSGAGPAQALGRLCDVCPNRGNSG